MSPVASLILNQSSEAVFLFKPWEKWTRQSYINSALECSNVLGALYAVKEGFQWYAVFNENYSHFNKSKQYTNLAANALTTFDTSHQMLLQANTKLVLNVTIFGCMLFWH